VSLLAVIAISVVRDQRVTLCLGSEPTGRVRPRRGDVTGRTLQAAGDGQ